MAEPRVTGPAPAIDPELSPALEIMKSSVPGGLPSLSADILPMVRAGFPGIPGPAQDHFSRDGRFVVDEGMAPGSGDNPDVPLLICRPAAGTARGCIVYIHGGGMVLGSNVNGVDEMLDYAEAEELAVVSVGYRLAPENPHPAPVEDCWTGLAWAANNATEIGLSGDAPIIIAGESAGGGLAAATALLARDRGVPHVQGQLLIAPMLDHRSETISMHLLGKAGMWDRESNIFGWSALLSGTENDVSPYASPALATDLTGLPPTFIDVGGADAFRDEAMDYASRLSRDANLVDLHLWAGAYHGSDGIVPNAQVSIQARATRAAWISRILDHNHRATAPASTSSVTQGAP